MRRTTTFISMLFLILAAATAQKESKGYTGDVTDVITIDKLPESGIYNKIWQPYIARWQKNHYVVTYGLQLTGKGDMGDILCSITKDGGKTWSPPTMMYNHRIPNGSRQYGYANSVLFIPEGRSSYGFSG
ncbi:MAG: hypothetical protein U5L72_03140 [Bacteroidales bacterium]|nr:hypothetical protein [Bacteroidales bacterium]